MAAYAVALLFVVADQWTKAMAVDSLASPIHPMVVAGDGTSDVRALFAARGVDAADVERAIASRSLWRLSPAVGLDLQAPLVQAGGQLDLLGQALGGGRDTKVETGYRDVKAVGAKIHGSHQAIIKAKVARHRRLPVRCWFSGARPVCEAG